MIVLSQSPRSENNENAAPRDYSRNRIVHTGNNPVAGDHQSLRTSCANPLTERERQASRVVASRRARGARQRKAMPPLSRSQAASAHSDRAGGGHENPAASELATEPAADAPVRREVENG
jgi:hypothetical protein